LTSSFVKCRPSNGMRNGNALVPSVTEIPIGTAVGGGNFRIMRLLGKDHVSFDWMGQVHRAVPVGVVMAMDLSFVVLTM